MTNSHFLSILLAFLFIIFSSCDEETISTPIYDRNVWDCHHESSLDLEETRSILIGTWKKEFMVCYSFAQLVEDFTDQNITIEFKPNGTLFVRNKGELTQFATWSLRDGDADLFKLDTRPVINELFGRIQFCDGHAVFNGSYIDGCDHYFIKKQ